MEQVQKRVKLHSAKQTPRALYKSANKLIQQHRCGKSTDAEAEQALLHCIDALQNGAASDPITHSYDLDTDDPQFLLAAAQCALGQLLEKQGRLQEAQAVLESSLRVFPTYVAAHVAVASVVSQVAQTEQELQLVEQHLATAVATAQQLAQVDKGLLLAANKVCRSETQTGEAARGRLALLLCQQGRFQEADEHLRGLGYRYRLSNEVLCYPLPQHATVSSQPRSQPGMPAAPGKQHADNEQDTDQPKQSPPQQAQRQLQLPALPTGEDKDPTGLIAVVDNALPPSLLQHMQQGFAPEAPFWREHNYGRVGYFSYWWPLDAAPTVSWQQLAAHVQEVAAQYFPAVREARFAELWAHCRRHPSGHQLHFDSDDEGVGGVRNPIISTVLYLSAEAPQAPPPAAAAAAADGGSSNGTADGSQIAALAPQQQQMAAAAAVPPGSCRHGDARLGSGTVTEQEAGRVHHQQQAANGAVQGFIGGPTLMTDQLLGGPLASQGWLAFPATNRLTMFDARYLHGVLPGRGPSPDAHGRRTTVMIAFWRDVACRPPVDGQQGPTMPLPQAGCTDGLQWPRCFEPRHGTWGSCSPISVQPVAVPAVWQSLAAAGTAAGAPTYDRCFQGF